jgi:hypothetical protein
VFIHASLLDEAEHAFEALAAANPTSDRANGFLAIGPHTTRDADNAGALIHTSSM